MAHHSCIGWVQVGGAWVLCVLHFHVCPWFICCPCACQDLRTRLHILLLVLNLLWHEWVFELSFFMSYFFLGLGLAWLWAFPSPICSLPFFAGWLILLPYHPDIPAMLLFDLYLLGLFWACCMLSLCSTPVIQYYCWACTHPVLGFHGPFHSFRASSAHFILLGIFGLFHFLGYPWLIPILHSHGFLLILLGFSA